jgi:hypothetical protein
MNKIPSIASAGYLLLISLFALGCNLTKDSNSVSSENFKVMTKNQIVYADNLFGVDINSVNRGNYVTYKAEICSAQDSLSRWLTMRNDSMFYRRFTKKHYIPNKDDHEKDSLLPGWAKELATKTYWLNSKGFQGCNSFQKGNLYNFVLFHSASGGDVMVTKNDSSILEIKVEAFSGCSRRLVYNTHDASLSTWIKDNDITMYLRALSNSVKNGSATPK